MAQFYINEKIIEVIILANFLMEKHGVDHFRFDFSNDKSKLGYCTGDTIELNGREIRNLIRLTKAIYPDGAKQEEILDLIEINKL